MSEKPKGWFSRRYQTAREHNIAVGRYGTRADRKARRQGVAEANAIEYEKRSANDQIAILALRPGFHVKEFARLVKPSGIEKASKRSPKGARQ